MTELLNNFWDKLYLLTLKNPSLCSCCTESSILESIKTIFHNLILKFCNHTHGELGDNFCVTCGDCLIQRLWE